MTSLNGNISALLALRVGNSPVTDEFPSQRPVARSFDIFFSAWTNGWVINGDVGDLGRHRVHYDVTVMKKNTLEGHFCNVAANSTSQPDSLWTSSGELPSYRLAGRESWIVPLCSAPSEVHMLGIRYHNKITNDTHCFFKIVINFLSNISFQNYQC